MEPFVNWLPLVQLSQKNKCDLARVREGQGEKIVVSITIITCLNQIRRIAACAPPGNRWKPKATMLSLDKNCWYPVRALCSVNWLIKTRLPSAPTICRSINWFNHQSAKQGQTQKYQHIRYPHIILMRSFEISLKSLSLDEFATSLSSNHGHKLWAPQAPLSR